MASVDCIEIKTRSDLRNGDAMMNPQDFDEFENSVPETFRSALRSRYGPVPEVSSDIDRAILADARRHLAPLIQPIRRRRWSTWKLTAIASTIAAAAVMFFVRSPDVVDVSRDAIVSDSAGIPSDELLMQDLDGSGRIDILDAFAIARRIRSGQALPVHDVNGDGQWDQADINEVAQRAVML